GELKVLRSPDGYSVKGLIDLEYDGKVQSLFPYLRREVLLFFTRARSDLLWLHAGAVRNNRGAVLICAMSGGGKSTLVTELCARGWKFLSDEAAPIRMKTNEVLPFPQLPRRRVYLGRALTDDELGSLAFEEIELTPADVSCEAAAIRT